MGLHAVGPDLPEAVPDIADVAIDAMLEAVLSPSHFNF
jgi:hypothetical protein